MQWVLWMIAVAVLGLAAVAASGRLGELPGTVTDTPRPHLPTGVVTGDDLRGLRFAVVPRGYSMDQVDELLDRLARQLDAGPTAGQPDRAVAGRAGEPATAPEAASEFGPPAPRSADAEGPRG
jgi:DivIVA domain-containing protein